MDNKKTFMIQNAKIHKIDENTLAQLNSNEAQLETFSGFDCITDYLGRLVACGWKYNEERQYPHIFILQTTNDESFNEDTREALFAIVRYFDINLDKDDRKEAEEQLKNLPYTSFEEIDFNEALVRDKDITYYYSGYSDFYDQPSDETLLDILNEKVAHEVNSKKQYTMEELQAAERINETPVDDYWELYFGFIGDKLVQIVEYNEDFGED